MNIKLLSGSYLTTTNKKHIKALLSAGLIKAKVNKISYFLEKISDDIFLVNIPKIEKSIIATRILHNWSTFVPNRDFKTWCLENKDNITYLKAMK